MTTDWKQEMHVRMCLAQVEAGYVEIDENGEARLTEKGKKRVAKWLDGLPYGAEVLIDLAFCESHELPVSLF